MYTDHRGTATDVWVTHTITHLTLLSELQAPETTETLLYNTIRGDLVHHLTVLGEIRVMKHLYTSISTISEGNQTVL